MQPVIGSGFGNFGRVLGPWTDFFPSSGGFNSPNSQFGVAIGTKIVGGARGATITGISIESPFNISGNNAGLNWKCYVIRGDLNLSALAALSNHWQQAANGWPRLGDNDMDLPVLWSKIIPAQTTVNNADGTRVSKWLFENLSGPSVGSGETMTVILVPLFNETGVPGYGANNNSYTQLCVDGVMDRAITGGSDKDNTARSIPRGRVSGV